MITTRRLDRGDRSHLSRIAVAGEVAHVALETAPIDGSTHVLEIYVEGFDEPLVVLADPVGAPDEAGFPLRLSPLDDEHADVLRQELFSTGPAPDAPTTRSQGAAPSRGSLAPPPLVIERESIAPAPLSQRHAASLAAAGVIDGGLTSSLRAPGSLTGRGLAGGRFVLETLLGTGAAGEVYRALHTVLRRPCAVKVLHPSLQRSQSYCTRFYSEALAASQLDHRNVLRIFDYGQEPDGTLYIVMELLEGRSLQQILDTEGRLALPRLVDAVSQACAGLAHAHDAGIVHRDIKPENIVVVSRKDDDGNATDLVKVCDFGIAHWVPPETEEVSDDDATLIRPPDASNVVGTPAYMSPEQCRNDAVDARTDVYALGVVLYELSTGQLPFTTFEPVEMLLAHATKPPAPPSTVVPDLDRDLERVIMRALEKEPAARQPNVRALRAELRALVSDGARYASVQSLPIVRAAPAPLDLTTHTAAALAELTVAAPHTRIGALPGLADVLRTAMSSGNVRLALELVTWLQGRLADRGLGADEHHELDRALRVARDPAPVRALTAHLFGHEIDRLDDAFPVLAVAGPVAARELLEARCAQPPSLEARVRFVACMRATGPAALPVVLGALARLTALASRTDEALADDLLRAAPEVPSDEGGELARRFVRPDRPALAVVALQRTVAFWGPRAYALILGVLDSTIDPVRLAAVEALQRLETLDDWAIDRLGRILLAQPPGASAELRAAAANTLALAPAQSRPRVVEFIRERLAQQTHGLVGSLLGKAPREDAKVLLALARSLMALDPRGARHELDRVLAARPELRVEINAVLAGF